MLLTPPRKQYLSTKIQSGERRLHFYGKGEEIPLLDHGVWCVSHGFVQLMKISHQGNETWLGWAQGDEFFGSWFTSLTSFQAKALSDVYVQWYSLNEIESSAQIAQVVLNQIVLRVKRTEELLAIAGLKRVEEKLLELLKLLGKYVGEEVDHGIRIQVRFTHQHLASAIGTTRVTVTRLLGDLHKQGLISYDEIRHLVITN